MHRLLPILMLCLAACATAPVETTTRPTVPPAKAPAAAPSGTEMQDMARTFATVVPRVEPVAEAICRAAGTQNNCDFTIVVDRRPGLPANAFQTLDRSGRPVIGFTLALINDAENADELAFVLGHEAAHHIAQHIQKQQVAAQVGALVMGQIVGGGGGTDAAIRAAQQVGAQVGGRTFSKSFELEADRLGTLITAKAGYNPVRGAEFFARIPDPGDKFLGSHPPNADRIAAVRAAAAKL